MSLKKTYLVTYNVTNFILWGTVLKVLLFCDAGIFSQNNLNALIFWKDVKNVLFIAQTLAIMECLHPLFKLTNSNVFTTIIQVFSRLHILWIIWRLVPVSRSTMGLYGAVGAWCTIELIRYSFYALTIINKTPSFLKWLRYSAFIILYPIGIASEVKSIISALDYLKVTRSLRQYPIPMPNMLNFEIDLYILYCCILGLYVPGSLKMYLHMMSQRNKAIQKTKAI